MTAICASTVDETAERPNTHHCMNRESGAWDARLEEVSAKAAAGADMAEQVPVCRAAGELLLRPA